MSTSEGKDRILRKHKKLSKRESADGARPGESFKNASGTPSSADSEIWSSGQMVQEYDISRLSTESLIESIRPIEAVTDQYAVEIIEESCLIREQIHIFLINLRISLWPKLKDYSVKCYVDEINKLKKCLLFTPISRRFNFASCTVGQFWAIVILAAKCCGEIFASTWIGYFLLSRFLQKAIPSLFFTFTVTPIFAYLLNKKIPLSKVSLAERRWLVLAFSFWVGASTHYILMNWDPGVFPPPPMYSPTLVALLFEFIGPTLANNRPQLLWSTIGVASFVCFAYAVVYSRLTFTYFYTSVTAIASSFYNMQLHLADPKLGRGDMSEGHVLLPIKSMYNQLAMILLFGHYIRNRDRRTTAPDSLEEQYTHLLSR